MDKKKEKIIEGLKTPAVATILYIIFAIALLYSGNGRGWWGFVALAMGVYSFAMWGLYLVKIHNVHKSKGRELSAGKSCLAQALDVLIVVSILAWAFLFFTLQGPLYFVPLALVSALIALEIIIVFMPEVKETFNVS